MNSFDLNILIWPIILIFFATLTVSIRITKWPYFSIILACIKAGIFGIYYTMIFDGTYTFFDDWTYLRGGAELLRRDVGLTNLSQNWDFIVEVGRGDHFLYYLYNSYAFRLFGEWYFAPVACNVILTVLVAYFGTKLALFEFNMRRTEGKVFFTFLLLHPDILAWSNVMNGKDISVLLLHVLLLSAISVYLRGRQFIGLFIAFPVVIVLFFLRFYVPAIFVLALVLSTFFVKTPGRIKVMFISAIVMIPIVIWISSYLPSVWSAIQKDFVNPVYGFPRAIMTPIPFGTEDSYAFLDFPALLHWIMMPFAIIGFHYIWKKSTLFPRFLAFYLICFMALYAVYGELQGPRHRVQLDFGIAILQFLGMKVVFVKLRKATMKAEILQIQTGTGM